MDHASHQFGRWQRNVATFGGAVAMLVVGAVTYGALRSARAARERVGHTQLVIQTTTATLSALQDAETGQRGYLITGDEAYLAPYNEGLAKLDADTAMLRAITSDNPRQGARLDTLAGLVAAKHDALTDAIDAHRAHGAAAAVAVTRTDRGKRSMDSIRALFHTMEGEEQSLLAARQTAEARWKLWAVLVLVGGTLAAALIALVVNGLLTRYAAAQEHAAAALATQNEQLQEQGLELELQHQELQHQAVELEMQNEQLQQQARELEAQAGQLEEQAAELEMANEELQSSADSLAERTEEAERASAVADEARLLAEEARQHAEVTQRVAEIANAAKSEFLAAMSHELRTPLNAITGYAELLTMGVRGPVTDTQLEDLRRIKKSSQHLLALINEILNLARVEARQVELRVTSVPVVELLDDVVALLAPQMETKGLTCVVAPGDVALVARADVERTQQILLNLLTNAHKFTDRGGRVAVECDRVEASVSAGMLCIRVVDTGRGIPEDKLAAIFEPFVQVDRRLTPDGEQGLGLGLAISRDLARAMGGELTVTSMVGEGSTFSLLLPVDGPVAIVPTEGGLGMQQGSTGMVS